MAEETKVVIPPCDITINRNDVDLSLKHFRILKGDNAEKFFPAPEVTPANLGDILKWIGDTNLVNEIQTVLKRKFQTIWKNSLADDGTLDKALFAKYAEDFTSAGMKMSDINNALDELGAELTKLIDKGDWATNPEEAKKLQDLNAQVRAYRQMKEDRSRKPSKEEQDEAAVSAE